MRAKKVAARELRVESVKAEEPGVIATVCHAPPATEYFNASEETPSGSLAVTETVTGAFAFGTAGECAKSENVGPTFGAKRELIAPGVPLRTGTSRSTVRASRLK